MTDQWDSPEELTADELADVEALLSRAGTTADLWADNPDWLEHSIVEAIAAEVAHADSTAGPESATVTSLAQRRDDRARQRWIAAAAAVVLLVGGLAAFMSRAEQAAGLEVAMVGTEAARGATASAELFETPAGLKILLDADGLEGAPPDYFYEAWVSDGTRRVSAGTFHLRQGDNEIELWAGVVDPGFNTISITLEPLDGVAESSGDVRLRGTFDLHP